MNKNTYVFNSGGQGRTDGGNLHSPLSEIGKPPPIAIELLQQVHGGLTLAHRLEPTAAARL